MRDIFEENNLFLLGLVVNSVILCDFVTSNFSTNETYFMQKLYSDGLLILLETVVA